MNLFTRKMHLFCVSNIMVSFVCTGFLAVPSYAIERENLEENAHAISLATSDTEPASRLGEEGIIDKALETFGEESPLDDEEEKEVKPPLKEEVKTSTKATVKKVSTSKKKTTVSSVVTKKEVASTKKYAPAKYSAVTGNAVVEYAKRYLGLRYVSGGNSLSTGTDCSGFTKLIYKEFGVTLSRAVRGQTGNGTYVRKADLQKGDLVFYGKKSGGGVTHVGIYMGNGLVIHESNHRDGVKISSVNMMRYITARRVINSKAIKIAEEKIEEQKQQTNNKVSVTNNTNQTVKSSDVVETITDKKEEVKENNIIENVQTTTNSQTDATNVSKDEKVEIKEDVKTDSKKEIKEETKVVETPKTETKEESKKTTTESSNVQKSDAVKEESNKDSKTKVETPKKEETKEVTE